MRLAHPSLTTHSICPRRVSHVTPGLATQSARFVHDRPLIRTHLTNEPKPMPKRPHKNKQPATNETQETGNSLLPQGKTGPLESSKKPRLTHFLALPLCTPASRPQLDKSLGRLKDSLVEQSPNGGPEHIDCGEQNQQDFLRQSKEHNAPEDGEDGEDGEDRQRTSKASGGGSASNEMSRIADQTGGHGSVIPSGDREHEPRDARSSGRSIEAIGGMTNSSETIRPINPDITSAGQKSEPAPKKHITIPEAAFRHPGSLHFTLGVMSLETPTQLDAAVSLLQSLDLSSLLQDIIKPTDAISQTSDRSPPFHRNDIEDPLAALRSSFMISSPSKPLIHPLTISLSSLSPLPKPRAATSLYTSPTPSHPLHAFALAVLQHFRSAGLIHDERDLLLHATLVNTIYAMKRDKGKRLRGGRRAQKMRALRGVERDAARAGAGAGEGGEVEERKGHGESGNTGNEETIVQARGGRLIIDARPLVQDWKNEVWARDIVIDRIVIYEMGAKKVYADDDETNDREGNVDKAGDEGAFPAGGRKERDVVGKIERDTRGEPRGGRRVIDQIYTEVASVPIIPHVQA